MVVRHNNVAIVTLLELQVSAPALPATKQQLDVVATMSCTSPGTHHVLLSSTFGCCSWSVPLPDPDDEGQDEDGLHRSGDSAGV